MWNRRRLRLFRVRKTEPSLDSWKICFPEVGPFEQHGLAELGCQRICAAVKDVLLGWLSHALLEQGAMEVRIASLDSNETNLLLRGDSDVA